MHVGGVLLFEAPEAGFDYDRLVRLIRNRIAFVPRYRQRVRWIPGRLSNPVWVDDESFDVTYHVRRSALPRPGTDAQLTELIGRIMSRQLDLTKPLWEMYLVEGLEGGRFAILTKTHHAMVDGVSAVDIGQVILDATPQAKQASPAAWRPAAAPSDLELVAGALGVAAGFPIWWPRPGIFSQPGASASATISRPRSSAMERTARGFPLKKVRSFSKLSMVRKPARAAAASFTSRVPPIQTVAIDHLSIPRVSKLVWKRHSGCRQVQQGEPAVTQQWGGVAAP